MPGTAPTTCATTSPAEPGARAAAPSDPDPNGAAEEPFPEGALPRDLPAQPAVFAPDVAPEEIAEIAARLRVAAGLPKKPTGEVA
ncbi:hypothetical protein [Conexibacter woesei]|uniref:hypothetical protein n=1 Tax=Conexibacter woesei TaxID=191495 RepID=UPI0002DD7DFD|nr:hypothetical protein [Conexibacter woesei]